MIMYNKVGDSVKDPSKKKVTRIKFTEEDTDVKQLKESQSVS